MSRFENEAVVDLPFAEDPQLSSLQSTIIDPIQERKNTKLKNAYILIFGCAIFLGILYFFNFYAIPRNSEVTNTILELLKTIILTLLGFLYGKTDE